MGTLLLVDDEHALLKALSRWVEDSGYACRSACDAAQAREMLDAQPYDLLLSDIHMPGESGLELSKYARSAYPEMAIVLVSGFDDPQDAQSALLLNAYGYLVKPFTRSQLLITIANALIRRGLEIEARHLHQSFENSVQQRTARLTHLISELHTAKSRLAAAIRDQKDQLLFLQTLLNALPNPIYYKNTTGVYMGCNPAFEAYIGRGREQIVGQTVYDIAPGPTADATFRADQQLLEGTGHQLYETKIIYADGTARDALVSKAVFKNSENQIAGLVGVMVDITERKRQESALRLSEEKIRSILKNIEIGVVLLSPEMEIIEVNEKMMQWFPGIVAEERPRCFKVIVSAQRENPCVGCPTRRTLIDGQSHEAIIQMKASTGIRSFRIVSSAIRDGAGRAVAAIQLVEDISEKVLMQRELIQSQKLASLGQLAAGVAHEINNPVGFVSSNLKTLNDYQTDLRALIAKYQRLKDAVGNLVPNPALQEVKALVAEIGEKEGRIELDYIRDDMAALIEESREGVDRIKQIVEDLKHFAHPGQDKVQDTNVNQELNSTLNIINNELKYKAAVIKQYGDLPLIKANPQQLNQVFANILVNAAQAIEAKGEIRIETGLVNHFVEIRISDTGCGIAEDHLDKIFDPFFTTKPVGKGTGLGMNIAYNIIRKHDGDIQVASRLGTGTCFTIRLPVDPAEKPQRAETPPHECATQEKQCN